MKKDLTASIVFFVVLTVSVISITISFPAEKDYHTTADEGTYFNQAKTINEQGWRGFKTLATEYKGNPSLHQSPPPTRIWFIFLASCALKFSISYHSLSMLSVLFFFLQCIASFLFVKRHWGAAAALITGVLLCVSPLSMGLARRALSDPCYNLFILLSLFSFIDFLRWQRKRNLIGFIIYFTFVILVKEQGLFLLPFFVFGLIINNHYIKKSFNLFIFSLLIFLPLILSGTVYMLSFGGIEKVMEIANSLYKSILVGPFEYNIRYLAGPWYQYFIDFFLLSPITAIFFFLYSGHYLLGNGKKNRQLNVLLLFFIYSILVFGFLPKVIRYVESLDVVYRVCAALFIIEIYQKIRTSLQIKRAIIAVILLLMVFIDVKAFHHYSLENEIYDPISFNLLSAENFFFGVGEVPLAETYLKASLYYYNKGNFNKCIVEAQKAISINPNYCAAYNNICCAYNEMKDWDHAIEAGNKAVVIDPNNQLAKNNLNWAISRKQLNQ